MNILDKICPPPPWNWLLLVWFEDLFRINTIFRSYRDSEACETQISEIQVAQPRFEPWTQLAQLRKPRA